MINVILLRQAEISKNPLTHLNRLDNGDELFGDFAVIAASPTTRIESRGGLCVVPEETALIGLDEYLNSYRYYGELNLQEIIRTNTTGSVRYLTWRPTFDTVIEAI